MKIKWIGTYHPAGVIYQWPLRSTVIADFVKADNERRHAEIVRPERRVQTSPSIEDLEETTSILLREAKLLAPDIETLNGQIRCIGFAWSRQDAIVVPFIRDLTGASYWFDLETELRAWECVRALLESEIPKVFQNGMFDINYLTRAGIYVRNCAHDTMLLHHVLYPELPKGLGFLGSIYSNESAWKLLRKHGEELKRDE
jgi:DNA polymerase I-like protein with 3'-5' exonuclease and polymerase domains